MLGYLAKPGVSAWCFGGVIVVDRVVKVVFRQSLFGAQKIRHGPDVFSHFGKWCLGRGYEKRPLYQSILFKSLIFAGLVLVFHIVEEVVKRIIAGEPSGTHVERFAQHCVVIKAGIVLFL